MKLILVIIVVLGLAYYLSPEEKKAKVRKTLKRWWNNFCDFLDEIVN